ncbi:hypothetical protein O0Q50_22280 [Priestia aryabhattai]|uniref:Uncharacterized protein n=1 Tax=Priestia aryabhattai TaxID=412384 RepID=A0AAX6NDI0_PRIAR|nr:hypothetical protein [Priestia aryabhattai]MDU9693912.1 hypothetical protein [Priestia aryabhattai]
MQTMKKIQVIKSNELKTDADLVCSHCGIDHYLTESQEGIDYVFEKQKNDEWCICIPCKKKCDLKEEREVSKNSK